MGDTATCEPRDDTAGHQLYGAASTVPKTPAATKTARRGTPKPPSRQMTRLPNVVFRALVRARLG